MHLNVAGMSDPVIMWLMKERFVITSHKPNKKYGLGAKPTRKAFKETKWNGFKLAMIPKENIGIDSDYQRVADQNQVARINQKWDGDIYEFVNVYRHYDSKTKLHYYQATDGQHRLCAHPESVVPCRIVNTKAPVTRCIEANDPRTKRAWTIDDQFWAKKAELDRIKIDDPEQIKAVIKVFKSLGWTPVNPSKKVPVDVGGRIAKIHKSWKNNAVKNIDKRKSWPTAEKRKTSLMVFDHVCQIMKAVFPDIDYHCSATRLWTAMFDWLTNDTQGLGLDYDVDHLIKMFQNGEWGIRRKKKEPLKTRRDYHLAANDYIRSGMSNDRVHDALLKVFNKMHDLSLR